MVAPYHLAIDLYTRGAVAELWGFVWLPFVMLFVAAQARRTKGTFLGIAITYALLMMTHLPTVVCFFTRRARICISVRGTWKKVVNHSDDTQRHGHGG